MILIEENTQFETIEIVCRFLGKSSFPVRKGYFPYVKNSDVYLWFPKFFNNDKSDNQLTKDKMIIEKSLEKDDEKYKKWYDKTIAKDHTKIVFGKLSRKEQSYTFLGIYKLEKSKSSLNGGICYKRIKSYFEESDLLNN